MGTKKVTKSVIWKFVTSTSTLAQVQQMEMPKGAEFLFAKNTGRGFKIWMKCNPEATKVRRTFVIVKTGMELPKGALYLGSCDSSPTHHFFEVKTKAERPSRAKK